MIFLVVGTWIAAMLTSVEDLAYGAAVSSGAVSPTQITALPVVGAHLAPRATLAVINELC